MQFIKLNKTYTHVRVCSTFKAPKNVEETKSTKHMFHTCLSWKSTNDGSKALLFVGRFKKPFDLSFPIADTDWIHPHQMLAYLLDLSSLRVLLEITFNPTDRSIRYILVTIDCKHFTHVCKHTTS